MRPSAVTNIYWLGCSRMVGEYPEPDENYSGKWMIFMPWKDIDEGWQRIRKATIRGKLGRYSKVSTKKVNPNSNDPRTGVIIVYTYDYRDKKDVMKIRNTLREMGFTKPLLYKSDADTRAGKYAKNGNSVYIYHE